MTSMIPYRFGRSPLSRASYNPFEEEFFRPFFTPSETMSALRVDVRDEGDHYLLEADLPGFSKDDVTLTVSDGVLTIEAEKHEEKKEEEKGKYLFSERSTQKVRRSFTLNGIDEAGIKAASENGVLKLVLPKEVPQEKVGRKISVE